jgi:hypothetical protein
MLQKYDAFISHNIRDVKNAEKLAVKLRDSKLKVWFEPWELQHWSDQKQFSVLSEALNECKNLLVLIGSQGVEPYHQGEMQSPFERAVRSVYRVIPVLLPGGSPTTMPMFLRTRVYCDLRNWDDKEINKLIEILRPAPRIFLCHAKEDDTKIERLYSHLKDKGLDPWYDKKELKVGDIWKEEIFQAIQETDFFAVCLSGKAVQKRGFIQNEIRTAIEEYQKRPFGTKYLLPLKLDDCEVPRIRLDSQMLMSDLQWLDLFPDEDEAFKNLANEILNLWNQK